MSKSAAICVIVWTEPFMFSDATLTSSVDALTSSAAAAVSSEIAATSFYGSHDLFAGCCHLLRGGGIFLGYARDFADRVLYCSSRVRNAHRGIGDHIR